MLHYCIRFNLLNDDMIFLFHIFKLFLKTFKQIGKITMKKNKSISVTYFVLNKYSNGIGFNFKLDTIVNNY